MLTHDEKEKLKKQNENFIKTFWKHQSQGLNPGKKRQNSLLYRLCNVVYTVSIRSKSFKTRYQHQCSGFLIFLKKMFPSIKCRNRSQKESMHCRYAEGELV